MFRDTCFKVLIIAMYSEDETSTVKFLLAINTYTDIQM